MAYFVYHMRGIMLKQEMERMFQIRKNNFFGEKWGFTPGNS